MKQGWAHWASQESAGAAGSSQCLEWPGKGQSQSPWHLPPPVPRVTEFPWSQGEAAWAGGQSQGRALLCALGWFMGSLGISLQAELDSGPNSKVQVLSPNQQQTCGTSCVPLNPGDMQGTGTRGQMPQDPTLPGIGSRLAQRFGMGHPGTSSFWLPTQKRGHRLLWHQPSLSWAAGAAVTPTVTT